MPAQPPIDQVREACVRLHGYLQALELLVTEPGTGPGSLPGIPQPRPHQPLPGDQAAFYALTTSLEGIRRLEAVLRYMTAGHPGMRRGMSPGNTLAVLEVLPKLAAGLDEDGEAITARILERWIWDCQAVGSIDEVTRYRPLPRGGGGLPAACPHCESVALKAVIGLDGRLTGKVECHVYGCRDSAGNQPVAKMGTDEHGRPCLVWADGLVQLAPELGTAA